MCEKKKMEENKRFEEEAEKAKTEEEVWKVVNKERRKRKEVTQNIEMVECKKYFIDFLGGAERKTEKGETEVRDRDDEEDISREEISRVLENLKVRKAPGIYEVPNEVWKYGGK